MKKINSLTRTLTAILMLTVVIFSGCSKQDELDRMYEGAKVVGVKVNGELYLPTYTNNDVNITLPAGKDLSKVKVQVLVANGTLQNFDNDQIMDVRKPVPLTLNGENGESKDLTLKVVSPPSLSNLIIEGLNVPKSDIYFGATSLIVQVPVGTNLTNLKVTMSYVNGTLQGFTNGTAMDYTNAKTFSIKGVDETTVYNYDFIITTEKVGPASVRSMTINGIGTDSVVVAANNTLIPYVKGLTDFSKSTVTIAAGFGNKVDPAFTGTNINMLLGNTKVKITGTDGIQVEFTIGVPQLSIKPIFTKEYADLGFAANDLTSVAFSGNHIAVSNYTASAAIQSYDLTGVKETPLNTAGLTAPYGFRKIASDSKGVILGMSLGITTNNQIIYKWDNVTATPTPYITYSSASLGYGTTAFRGAGINIQGSLDGDAIITVGQAQKADVFVWTVTGGILNPTPTKLTHPYPSTGYYWSLEPMPIGTPGYVALISGTSLNGIASLTSTLGEVSKVNSISATDGKIIKYNGRVYLAFTVFQNTVGTYFRIADITDNQLAAIQNPIMNVLMKSSQGNGNVTMDADMAVINGKLHAVFACTNIGMQLFKLEQ
ncbi:MAG TPA: hypothetical protein VF273_10135 [Pelobium sp.]